MKNETKYYTPSIEEFYVGFEYQRPEIKLPEEEFIWVPEVYGNMCYIENSNKIIKRDCFQKIEWMTLIEKTRVKHLDRYDIESLGWEIDASSRDFWCFHLKKESKYNHALSFSLDGSVNLWNNEENIFKGTIKNKSELKKVMVMLGITKIEGS